MKLKAIVASLSTAMLTACSGVDVTQYANENPKLDLPVFLNGSIDAWGVFQKRSGEIARRFTVEIQANWTSRLMSTFFTLMAKNSAESGH